MLYNLPQILLVSLMEILIKNKVKWQIVKQVLETLGYCYNPIEISQPSPGRKWFITLINLAFLVSWLMSRAGPC